MKKIRRYLIYIFYSGIFLLVTGVSTLVYLIFYYSSDLPDFKTLGKYNPPTITRLYANDGKIFTEYAREKRLYVPIDVIPDLVINAFIAAEDKNFYNHPGIDFVGVARAVVHNIVSYNTGQGSLVGGSTITQQVVKNFLLTKEKSFSRKAKEAILAFRITRAFSKQRIMELYLNEIYLGSGAYGIAAAALNYFNKSVDELNIEEAALLAAMPQAPSRLDPRKNYNRALNRRNWVIERMIEDGFIEKTAGEDAVMQPINIYNRSYESSIPANAFAEEVRKFLVTSFDENFVYEGGLMIRTTLDSKLQDYAVDSLRKGLEEYDIRHGWRGATIKVQDKDNWQEQLINLNAELNIYNREYAYVIDVNDQENYVDIVLSNARKHKVTFSEINKIWKNKFYTYENIGRKLNNVNDMFSIGDIIMVEKSYHDNKLKLQISQIPEVNGAIVAIDPNNGKIRAMAGGYNEDRGQFNRATQAQRQPGSAFKPFVYLAAMEEGFTPAHVIIDEPIELPQGPNLPMWKPQNFRNKFYGPSTLRQALQKSQNVVTVRLATLIGINKIIDISERFGIFNNPKPNYSMVLGAHETSLLNLTNAYGMIVNGGRKIKPSYIEWVQNRYGKTIYKFDDRECTACNLLTETNINDILPKMPPIIYDKFERVTDPQSAYQITYLLQGAVEEGTARRAKAIGRTIGGKTGSTNDSHDAWFIGFTPNLVVGSYIGFDSPTGLGRNETGASVALPVVVNFMKDALKDYSDQPFPVPNGISLVKIDARTGNLPNEDTDNNNIIFEAFKKGSEPGLDKNYDDFEFLENVIVVPNEEKNDEYLY